MSPEKDQEGNSSPWRIRVTLEATQDEDEENQGSPARKLFGPSTTMTTKVPLKDERDNTEPTPRKRRGRPRKTDIQPPPDATPTAASPGHTPGAKGTSGQSRGRGRPRKNTYSSDEPQVAEQPTPIPEPPTPVPEQPSSSPQQPTPTPAQRALAPEQPAPIPEKPAPVPEDPTPSHEQPTIVPKPEQERYSPLHLGADGDSDDSDDGDLPGISLPMDNFKEENETGRQEPTDWNRSSPRVTFAEPTYDTPDVGAIDRDYDGNFHSTPSKMPSSTHSKPLASSPANTLNAGHTPRPPPRLYPTPTSSSLVDEENEPGSATQNPPSEFHQTETQTNDPTKEYREFDSIMESEGFSMVSLDTLPSAKQHGISTNTDRAKGPLKPFLQRETGVTERNKRKASAMNTSREDVSGMSAPGVESPEPPPKRQSRSPPKRRPRPKQPTPNFQSPKRKAPMSPPGEGDISAPTPDRRYKPVSRLARIVRAGLALEGAFRQHHGPELWTDDLATPKKRLEHVFNDFDYDTQQELRAGLGLGREIAKRKLQTETERFQHEEAARNVAAQNTYEDEYEDEGVEEGHILRTPQTEQGRTPLKDTPGTEMRRRMEEWQHEREAISREIERANSSQVVVINSDESAPQSPDRGRNDPGDEFNEPEYEPEPEPEFAPGSDHRLPLQLEGGFDDDDDDGVEAEEMREDLKPEDEALEPQEEEEEDDDVDIWQQEAKEPSQLSQRSSMRHQEDDASRQASSPSKAPSDYTNPYSPAAWTHEREKVPYLGGQSRIRQLRQQEIDFSTLLHGNTPYRSRYYYGTNSPQSTENGRSPQRAHSIPQSPQRYVDNVQGQEPLSEIGLESSPHKPSDDDAFQIDPTTRIEHERLHFDRRQNEENYDYSDAAVADDRFVHEQVNTTPWPLRNANPENQGSTWFQRLASLTPGWLKAPTRRSSAQPSRVSEESSDDSDEEDVNAYSNEVEPEQMDRANTGDNDMEQRFRSSRRFTEWRQYEPQSSPESRVGQPVDHASSPQAKYESPARPRSLAVSGYFTNEHYIVFRRLYRLAKQSPERFPYNPARGRAEIIGDWIWTSDGKHGTPVTEGQFAVIDRFVQKLAAGDLQSGGTGLVGWTEADLHRRLISVIIGEQIRAERKATMSEVEM